MELCKIHLQKNHRLHCSEYKIYIQNSLVVGGSFKSTAPPCEPFGSGHARGMQVVVNQRPQFLATSAFERV